MILREVYARFYKSFNYDFLRKNHEDAKPRPWEQVEGKWYPYVRVPIEEDITTIVGANESGKTHLLTIIEKGITGVGINREDFCRYSHFYTVELGKRRWPDFGFRWTGLTAEERQTIAAACGLEGSYNFDQFYFFRENKDTIRLFIPVGEELKGYTPEPSKAQTVCDLLPKPFRINAEIALPSSVPISLLGAQDGKGEADQVVALGRKNRMDLMRALLTNRSHFASAETVKNAAAALASQIGPFTNPSQIPGNRDGAAMQDAEFKLARDLICKVARIDPEALGELNRAIREGLDGYVNGIIEEINKALETALNFPHWWIQDHDFSLRVDAREHDLVFTIRDRTETDYSFQERSHGLKYFLSYYIQYLAHSPQSAHGEILLMDEPDAYLSSQAQQDLLKVFHAFAHPESTSTRSIQVVYVTHSPFLIDRNHADRIRVLEKGSGDEGTRIVRNPSRNHYEPLRSALGAFVAETTFIGNCNLMVEGTADQVLLAGAATFLKARGATDFQTLDLNRVTIVPAGSATHVPYLVYLARGRDYEKPAVIVLLDSDPEANDAKARLLKSGPLKRLKLRESLILQVGDVAATFAKVPSGVVRAVEIEDLVPLEMALAAVRTYFAEFDASAAAQLGCLNAELVKGKMEDGKSVFDALNAGCKTVNPAFHLDKIGFARAVLRVVHEWTSRHENLAVVKEFADAMTALFARLARMQRESLKEISQERVTQRVGRAKKTFLQDHAQVARREEAGILFEDIESALDDEPESDAIRTCLDRMRRQFKLKDDVTKPIEDFEMFKEQLQKISYADVIVADDQGKRDALLGAPLANGDVVKAIVAAPAVAGG